MGHRHHTHCGKRAVHRNRARYPESAGFFPRRWHNAVPAQRFASEEKTMKERRKRLPNGFMYELKKFYYDTAQANHPAALAALLKLVTPLQMLYGTDYPFRTGAEVNDGLSPSDSHPKIIRRHRTRQRAALLPKLRCRHHQGNGTDGWQMIFGWESLGAQPVVDFCARANG